MNRTLAGMRMQNPPHSLGTALREFLTRRSALTRTSQTECKAYVLALSHSLHHELAGNGVRIQAVLPSATATDFWGKPGLP
jgi:NAD(P)-dependent dehydrogenase (short-subunit alcohol dehydrogenase family)